jgi:uncharacterized protein (TIGR04255 family)
VPLNLPPVDLGFLPASPLELVVCQVRHDDRLVDAQSALAIQDALGGPDGFFPRIEQVELRVASMTVAPGMVSPAAAESFNGWHLKSADGSWTAAVLPGHFSLETTSYTRWREFEDRLNELTRAVAGTVPPVMEQRLGLRYVDRLTGLGVREPEAWAKWIASSILGPPLHPVVGVAVTSTRQQVDLDLGDGHLCVLRHGTVRDGDAPADTEASYLLDFDIYRSQSRRFVSEHIATGVKAFHEKADALFRQVITDELLLRLQSDNNV